MSRLTKIPSNVKRFVIETRRRNTEYGVRQLASLVTDKYNIKISKSSIAQLIKNARLSNPVGRSVLRSYRYCGAVYGCGYSFFVGACRILEVPGKTAAVLKELDLLGKTRLETASSLIEAWLTAKAIYNVTTEKIAGYSKKELWDIIGYKISKRHLEEFIRRFKYTQDIANKLVTMFLEDFSDTHCLKCSLADGSSYYLDGGFHGIWRDNKVPVNFSLTSLLSMRYMNEALEGREPLLVMNAKCEGAPGDELLDFMLSMDGSVASKRLRKVSFLGPDNRVVRDSPFVLPLRRRFVIGVWPGQHKAVAQADLRRPLARLDFAPLKRRYSIFEETVKLTLQPVPTEDIGTGRIPPHGRKDKGATDTPLGPVPFGASPWSSTQHIGNKEFVTRLVLLQCDESQDLRIGLFTNLSSRDWAATEIAELYLRRFGDFQANARLSQEYISHPGYLEERISPGQVMASTVKLKEAQDLESFLSQLVEICAIYAKKCFLPPGCRNWSLLKMRELIYKPGGEAFRDMPDDVLFKMCKHNMLEQNGIFAYAAVKFNESPVFERSGRKIWFQPGS